MQLDLDAPVPRVWQAWTDPKDVAVWYGPGPEGCRVEQMDVRPGGAYRRFMGEHLDEGVFHEVEAPRRLLQGWADRSFLIETVLEPHGDGTRMTLRMAGLPPEQHEHVKAGWDAGFEKLRRLL